MGLKKVHEFLIVIFTLFQPDNWQLYFPFSDLVKKVMAQTGRNYDKALYFLSSNNWDIRKLQAGTSKPATKVVKRK